MSTGLARSLRLRVLRPRWVWSGEGEPFRGEVVIVGERIAAVRRYAEGRYAESRSLEGGVPLDEITLLDTLQQQLAPGIPRESSQARELVTHVLERIGAGETSVEFVDLGDTLLLPGLVNAHVHLDLTFDRPHPELNQSFPEWLLGVRDLRLQAGEEGLERAAREGVAESLRSGTTLVIDYDARGAAAQALAGSFMRAVLLREVIDFGGDDETVATWKRRIDEYTSPDEPRTLRAYAAHAPYTVNPRLLKSLLGGEYLMSNSLLTSIHLSETPAEFQFLHHGSGDFAEFFRKLGLPLPPFELPGTDPIPYLQGFGGLRRELLLIHGNYLDTPALEAVAASGCAVVYCPRSHHFFGHREHPYSALAERGVAVCLGTDGKISSGDLSMLREIQQAQKDHPEASLEELFQSATVTPRRWLRGRGVSEEVTGPVTLAAGEMADMVAVDCVAESAAEVLREVLREPQVRAVYLSGSRLPQS